MITIYNRADVARVHEPRLRSIIEYRINALGDLMDWTEILVVEPGDSEADIIREAGFSPLLEPIDGIRFGGEGFRPFWDHLTDCGGWFELSVSFGSSFAYILFIADAEDLPPGLCHLCNTYGA